MQIINEKKSVEAALNSIKEIFVIHVSSLDANTFIYLSQNTHVTLLIADKVIVLKKYLYYADVFLKKLAIEMHKYLGINKYAIDVEIVALSNISSLLIKLPSWLFRKLNSFFCLYIDYQDLNNLIIKN